MADDMSAIDPLGRPSPTVQDLLAQEDRPLPAALAAHSVVDLGLEGAPASEYTDPAFASRELERMWGRVWQMACREDELRAPGDHILYEIGRRSVIVTRTPAGEIAAFHNVCLHRGRRLRDAGGKVGQFRCPYHGFTWTLEGALKETPCAWDFPQIDPADFRLKSVRTDTWGGFVFVTFDPDAPPLREQLEDIPEIFAHWPLEERYTQAHVSKVLRCNWKVALEAFVETLHVTDTHPQIASYIGDAYTQYDIWPGKRHYSRMISPRGIPSPSQRDLTPDEVLQSSEAGAAETLTVPPGSTARREMGNRKRARLSAAYGRDMSAITDSEAVDTIQYFIFPNLVCWWGHGSPINYRFRPLGEDPGMSVMEIFYLTPDPVTGPKPLPANITHLGPDQPWTDAPELGLLGGIADQDSSNLEAVQKGLNSGELPFVTLARYHENRIRHFHKTLREYVDG